MSKKIAGVSKRHFRRLVAKEREKLFSKINENESAKNGIKEKRGLEEVYIVDHAVPNLELCKEDRSSEEEDNQSLEDAISDWVVENRISLIACDRLLKILSSYGIRMPKHQKALNQPEIDVKNTNLQGEDVLEMLKSLRKETQTLKSSVDDINTQLLKHGVIIKRISEESFPDIKNFNIFPIDSLEELKEIEGNLDNLKRAEVISYIKRNLSKLKISKQISIMFTNNIILDINWDGLQGKHAIKNYALFNSYVYEALRTPVFSFEDYANEMKVGIKLAKSRVYRNKHKAKCLKQEAD